MRLNLKASLGAVIVLAVTAVAVFGVSSRFGGDVAV
jgi:hypothetical protein